MSTREALNLLQRYDRTLDRYEREAIQSLDALLLRAFQQLEQQLRLSYPALQNTPIIRRQAMIAQQLASVLDLANGLQGEYQRAFEQLIQQASAEGGQSASDVTSLFDDELGQQMSAFANVPIEAVAAQARGAADRMRRHGADFAGKASAAIETNLTLGRGIGATVKVLRNELGITRGKAEQIARTESIGAFDSAAQQRYEDAGLYSQIFSVGDRRVCPFCAHRNGRVYKTEDVKIPFHPMCLVPGTEVSSTHIKACTSRQYRGEVIFIETTRGKKLTVTPNHPILTNKGWIAAGLLNEGMNVFSSIDSEGVSFAIDPDRHNRPALIEEIVAAFSESSSVSSVSMPISPEDFHGDGLGSKVSVIFTDGKLRSHFKSNLIQIVQKTKLMLRAFVNFAMTSQSNFAASFPRGFLPFTTEMGVSSLVSSLFRRHTCPFHGFGFRLPSYGSVRISKNFAYRATHDAKMFSHRILRDATQVHINSLIPNISTIGTKAFNTLLLNNRFPFGTRSHQTSLMEGVAENGGVEMEELSRLIARFSGKISSDRVIKTGRSFYEGHVYNLETKTGWYFANDIITHNCRCYRTPYRKEWAEKGLIDEGFVNQYTTEGLAELKATGKEPDSGLAPFERLNRRPKPPRSVWSPGTRRTPTPAKTESSEFLEREEARKQYKLLGSGIEGEVFLDEGPPPRALKYASRLSESDFGDDVPADLIRQNIEENEAAYNAALQGVRRAGDLGIAPKLYNNGLAGRDRVFAMEFLEGYTVGIHPMSDEFDLDFNTRPYDTNFIQKLRIAHRNRLVVSDLHEDNVMVNANTFDIKFIDQGEIEEGTPAELADQVLNIYSWRPLAAQTIEGYINQHGTSAQRRQYKKIRREYDNRDDSPISEERFDELIGETYGILEALGV